MCAETCGSSFSATLDTDNAAEDNGEGHFDQSGRKIGLTDIVIKFRETLNIHDFNLP